MSLAEISYVARYLKIGVLGASNSRAKKVVAVHSMRHKIKARDSLNAFAISPPHPSRV